MEDEIQGVTVVVSANDFWKVGRTVILKYNGTMCELRITAVTPHTDGYVKITAVIPEDADGNESEPESQTGRGEN